MIFFAAAKAERISTFANYSLFKAIIRSFGYIVTILLWAPFNAFIMVGELFAVPEQILFSIVDAIFIGLIWQVRKKHRVWNSYITSQLRTLRKHAIWPIRKYFIPNVVAPAGGAVFMPTAQRNWSK